MKPIFGKNLVPVPTDEDHYVDFCRSPLNTPEESRADFRRLVSQPGVVAVAFKPKQGKLPRSLVVVTEEIIITHQSTRYVIGRFAMFIMRFQDPHGYWVVDYKFKNLTRCLESQFGVTHHPHITDTWEQYDIPLGRLCIQRGAFPIRNAIRMGRISEAVARLLKVLHTYDAENPFLDIEFWSRG
jgi:hypothetical protein